MHFSIAKSKVIHLGTKNQGHAYKMGDSPRKQRFGITVDNQLNMRSQHDTVAKRAVILGCIKGTIRPGLH